MVEQKGFPFAYMVVNGSLIQIECPHDFEGWYCRKGYPAFNVQIVMDYKQNIHNFDKQPGLTSNKQISSNLYFGQTIHRL